MVIVGEEAAEIRPTKSGAKMLHSKSILRMEALSSADCKNGKQDKIIWGNKNTKWRNRRNLMKKCAL